MRLLCAGLNHKTASLELREKLALDDEALRGALRRFREQFPDAEWLLLCTCNRTELYAAREVHGHPRGNELADALATLGDVPPKALEASLYVYTHERAIRHLFEVAGGMDSLVPGEAQILGQLKRAFRLSREEHAAGGFLASLVDEALHVAKHIHNETGLGEGKVSIASLAMEEIRRNIGDLSHRCVMSIGAGKMNELLLKQLASHRCRLLIANRSEDKARELAEAYGGRYVKFADIRHRMQEADVLVSCTGATEPIITRRCLADCLARRHEGMLLIDLAVPRDIDPAGANLPGVVLKNIDQLEGAARDGIDRRCEHMGKATDLVNEHVRDYLRAQASAEVNPTIEALYRRVEEIIEEETSEAENKFSTHPDAEEDMDILRRSLRRSLRRFCHHAVDTLRAEAAEGSGGPHAALLRKLFKLEDEG